MHVHPAFGVPVHARAEYLSADSDEATARTIERMDALASEDRRHASIARISHQLCAGRSAAECVASVHQWVRHNVRFVQDAELAAPLGVDPSSAEVLIRPVAILRMPEPQGDCDDFSMLVASLLLAADIPCSFATVAANSDSPSSYSHVYVVAHLPDGDVPIDASHGRVAGWEVPNLFGKLREWGVGGMDHNNGLGFVSTGASSGGFEWGPTIQSLITGGFDLTKTLLAPPTYKSGPGGTEIRATGQSPLPSVLQQPGGIPDLTAQLLPGVSNSMLLLGGLAVVAVILISKK